MQGIASAFALPTAMRTGLHPLPLFMTWHVIGTCLLTLSESHVKKNERIAADCRTRYVCHHVGQSGQGLYLVRLPDPIRGQSLLAFIHPAIICTDCCGPFV